MGSPPAWFDFVTLNGQIQGHILNPYISERSYGIYYWPLTGSDIWWVHPHYLEFDLEWPWRLSSNQLITPVTEMLVPRWHHIVCMNSRHINISMPCSEIDSTLRSRTRSIKHTNNIYWNLFKFDVRCVNGISFKLVYVLSPKHNPNVMALLNTSLQSRPIWAFCFHNPMICGDTRTLNSSQNNTSRINFMSK